MPLLHRGGAAVQLRAARVDEQADGNDGHACRLAPREALRRLKLAEEDHREGEDEQQLEALHHRTGDGAHLLEHIEEGPRVDGVDEGESGVQERELRGGGVDRSLRRHVDFDAVGAEESEVPHQQQACFDGAHTRAQHEQVDAGLLDGNLRVDKHGGVQHRADKAGSAAQNERARGRRIARCIREICARREHHPTGDEQHAHPPAEGESLPAPPRPQRRPHRRRAVDYDKDRAAQDEQPGGQQAARDKVQRGGDQDAAQRAGAFRPSSAERARDAASRDHHQRRHGQRVGRGREQRRRPAHVPRAARVANLVGQRGLQQRRRDVEEHERPQRDDKPWLAGRLLGAAARHCQKLGVVVRGRHALNRGRETLNRGQTLNRWRPRSRAARSPTRAQRRTPTSASDEV
eukprot:4052919-Prymnesium_polylepis.1